MIDLESMVKEELENTHGIEELIEEKLESIVADMVEQWVNTHDLPSWISDAVELTITKAQIADACESAIERIVEDAINN